MRNKLIMKIFELTKDEFDNVRTELKQALKVEELLSSNVNFQASTFKKKLENIVINSLTSHVN